MQHIQTHNYIKYFVTALWTQWNSHDLNVPNNLFFNLKCAIELTKKGNKLTPVTIKSGSKEQNAIAKKINQAFGPTIINEKAILVKPPNYCKKLIIT